MKKFLIGVLSGLLIGGGLTFYFFIGVPSATQLPGALIRPPDPGTAGTAQIVLKQDFFNDVVGTIFREMDQPAFQVATVPDDDSGPRYTMVEDNSACDGKIRVIPEGSGVRTELRFDNNRIAAPIAFSGSYNSLFGCLRYTGWAQANLALRFDESQQAVLGILSVETVNLDGVNPVLAGVVTPLVQSTLNNRVNPILIVDGKQIAINVPVASTGGRLQASVKDIRADIGDNALNLYVVYEFHAGPAV